MNIPREMYQTWFGSQPTQENSYPDGNGNELYHGVAPANAAATDGSWIITKGIYQSTTQNGVSGIWWGVHYSTLQGFDSASTPVSWATAIAGGLIFP